MFLTVFPLIYAQERIAPIELYSFALFFALVAHDKRATEAICSFSQANCSIAHQKQVNPSKNQ